jgi:hypothetical protein
MYLDIPLDMSRHDGLLRVERRRPHFCVHISLPLRQTLKSRTIESARVAVQTMASWIVSQVFLSQATMEPCANRGQRAIQVMDINMRHARWFVDSHWLKIFVDVTGIPLANNHTSYHHRDMMKTEDWHDDQ